MYGINDLKVWLRELRPECQMRQGVLTFDPLPLFTLAGLLVPDELQQIVNLQGCGADSVEAFIFEVVGEQLALEELLTVELDSPWCPGERSLVLASVGQHTVLTYSSVEDHAPYLTAIAAGTRENLLSMLCDAPDELLANVGPVEARVVRIVPRSLLQVSRSQAAHLAAMLTGKLLSEALVVE